MTIAIHESALIRHFNTRKEVLRAWEERIGARFSPFRGFKMPDSRLYIEDSDFLDSIVDLIITNERHVFIRGPVGSGKSTLMLLALRDLPTLADRKGNKFVTGYVGMTGLYEKQMAAAIADSLRVKYKRSWESSQIIEDVADNQEAAFHKLRFLADLPTEEMVDTYGKAQALDEPIVTLVMSGTLIYWNAMLSFLPQIADRTEPLDSFDIDSFDIYPFSDESINVINTAARGNPRDIRMLARGCQQVAAENFRKNGDPNVDKEIASLVSQAYATILREVQ